MGRARLETDRAALAGIPAGRDGGVAGMRPKRHLLHTESPACVRNESSAARGPQLPGILTEVPAVAHEQHADGYAARKWYREGVAADHGEVGRVGAGLASARLAFACEQFAVLLDRNHGAPPLPRPARQAPNAFP